MDKEELHAFVRDAVGELPLEDLFWVGKGVEGAELARAILFALARRLGKEFVDEVTDELVRRRDALVANPMSEEREIGQLLQYSDVWNDLDEAEKVTGATSGPARA